MTDEPSTILIPTEPHKGGQTDRALSINRRCLPRQRAIDVIDERERFQFKQTQRATLLKERLPVGDLGFLTTGVVYRSCRPGRTAISRSCPLDAGDGVTAELLR
jgi:hypothetical protein